MINQTTTIKLQELFFDAQDLKKYSCDNLGRIIEIMTKYEVIIAKLHIRHPRIFDNFFQISIYEIVDHLDVLKKAVTNENRCVYFLDLQFYLKESILDARSKLIPDEYMKRITQGN